MPDRLIAINLQLKDNYTGPLKGAAAATSDFAKKADGVGKSAAGFDQASRSIAGVSSQSRQAQVNVAGVGGRFDQMRSKVRGVTQELGGFKGALASFGGGVIGGLAAGGLIEGATQIKDFLGEATQAASDLNETQNKANVIFGKQAQMMDSWADGAAKSFGLSKAAALDYSSQLGDMFTQLGNTGPQAADLSKQVVQLAADLGSFNNLDTGDVLERIQAGFRGEYDSLQLLVPNINAARVQQVALAETGKKSAGALTGQEKAAATLAVIMQDTSRAQGDFARTADQAANKAKSNAARMDDLRAKIGQQLLPVYKTFLDLMSSVGIPVLSAFADGFAAVVTGVGGAVSIFRSLPAPLQAAALAFGALALANRLFGTQIAGMGSKVTGLVSSLGSLRSEQRLVVTSADGLQRSYTGVGAVMQRMGQQVPVLGRMHDSFMQAAAGAERFPRTLGVASAAMTGMRGAASGLLGVLGGPWGLAITAGVTALVAWQQGNADSAEKVAAHRQAVLDMTDAIKADSGALGEHVKAKILDNLQTADAFNKAKQYGISVRDVTAAAMGNQPAIDRVTKALQDNGSATDDAGTLWSNFLGFIKATGPTMQVTDANAGQLTSTMKTLNPAAQELSDTILGQTTIFEDGKTAIDQMSQAQALAKGTASDLKLAQEDLMSANKALSQSLDDAKNKFLDARGAARDYRAALREALDTAKKQGGAGTTSGSEKADENQAKLDAVASNAVSGIQKAFTDGASGAALKAKLDGYKKDLYSVAAAFHLTGKAADDYVNGALGKIPADITTKVNAETEVARAKLLDLKGAAQQANSQTVMISSDVPLSADTIAKLKNIDGVAVTTDGKSVSVDTTAPGAQQAYDLLAAVQAKADALNGKVSTVTIRNLTINETRSKMTTGARFDDGWAGGGYTGPGGKYDIAGAVHRGEVVWSQDDVAAHGGPAAVDALRRERNGYATGGVVPGYATGGVADSNFDLGDIFQLLQSMMVDPDKLSSAKTSVADKRSAVSEVRKDLAKMEQQIAAARKALSAASRTKSPKDDAAAAKKLNDLLGKRADLYDKLAKANRAASTAQTTYNTLLAASKLSAGELFVKAAGQNNAVNQQFINDIKKIKARGFGPLALQLLNQGDEEAMKVAHSLANGSLAQLTSAAGALAKSGSLQQQEADLKASLDGSSASARAAALVARRDANAQLMAMQAANNQLRVGSQTIVHSQSIDYGQMTRAFVTAVQQIPGSTITVDKRMLGKVVAEQHADDYRRASTRPF